MQLPEGEAKSDGASAIIFEMTKYGLVKASGWLEKLPTGGSRDAAVKSFTNSIGEDDPGGAVALAASISNAPMRNSEVERWARTWLLRDKAAATKWIAQNAALDWAVKRRLLWKD